MEAARRRCRTTSVASTPAAARTPAIAAAVRNGPAESSLAVVAKGWATGTGAWVGVGDGVGTDVGNGRTLVAAVTWSVTSSPGGAGAGLARTAAAAPAAG